ncbi:hypothetical protein RclHR1_14020001 [Rhizophagus clarus]|uniref:Uncharacterized protein n=1 Tax=Rhizophagus clarus TaxID=94130 RepID=A0A2Z6QG22_9GLOM|nr:hypothetical protein RclHR1_14020001 [Rhizophagus clarus]
MIISVVLKTDKGAASNEDEYQRLGRLRHRSQKRIMEKAEFERLNRRFQQITDKRDEREDERSFIKGIGMETNEISLRIWFCEASQRSIKEE